MFDILAASYMSAARMEHFLEVDFMHKDARIARKLRAAHGMGSPERIDLSRARTPFRIPRPAARAIGAAGRALGRFGRWLDEAATRSYRREIDCPAC